MSEGRGLVDEGVVFDAVSKLRQLLSRPCNPPIDKLIQYVPPSCDGDGDGVMV